MTCLFSFVPTEVSSERFLSGDIPRPRVGKDSKQWLVREQRIDCRVFLQQHSKNLWLFNPLIWQSEQYLVVWPRHISTASRDHRNHSSSVDEWKRNPAPPFIINLLRLKSFCFLRMFVIERIQVAAMMRAGSVPSVSSPLAQCALKHALQTKEGSMNGSCCSNIQTDTLFRVALVQ